MAKPEVDIQGLKSRARQGSLLAALPHEMAAKILASGEAVNFRSGQALFEQGDQGDSAYLVLSGTVRISVVSRSGRYIVLAYAGPGDLLGEIAVLDGSSRSAAGNAVEPVQAFRLRGVDLRREMAASAQLSLAIIKFLCGRLAATNQLLESDRSYDTGQRLARGILRLLEEHGREAGLERTLSFAIGQSDLGAFVSASRENVSRQLAEWARSEIIEVRGNRIVLKDREAMEEIADLLW